MAKRKRGRGRRMAAIAVLPTAIALYPAMKAYKNVGITNGLPGELLWQYTGYSVNERKWHSEMAMPLLGAVIAAFVGHKIANRVGINRSIRKATGGYLSL